MRCEDCRDAISARMDGEDPEVAADAVEGHLAGCAACHAFADRAAHVTRLARIRPAENHPDVLPELIAALDAGAFRPVPRRTGRAIARDGMRVALAVLGIGQLALALSGIVAATGAAGGTGELAGASMRHFSHESAAWNLALGVAFLWAVGGTARRAGGLVPVIVGLVLLLLRARLSGDGGTFAAAGDEGATRTNGPTDGRFTRRFGDGDGDGDVDDGSLRPTAHHPAA